MTTHRAWPNTVGKINNLTTSLKQALAIVDVHVPDHFIVAGGKCSASQNTGLCEASTEYKGKAITRTAERRFFVSVSRIDSCESVTSTDKNKNGPDHF